VVIARQLPQTLRHRYKGHLVRGAAAIGMAFVLVWRLDEIESRVKLFSKGMS
jgi:hypothetical protein